MKYPLEDLKKKSYLAATNPDLAEIALTQTPSSAWDIAEAGDYSEANCRSVRYLAMIRRDCGVKVFLDVCREANREKARRRAAHEIGDEAVWTMDQVWHGVQALEDGISTLEKIFTKDDLIRGFGKMRAEHRPQAAIASIENLKQRLTALVQTVSV